MEKRIPFFHFQSVKAVAKAIDPHLKNLDSLKRKALAVEEEFKEKQAKLDKERKEKLGKVKQEYDACETQINALEAGVLQVTGLHVADLVKKVIEPTGKTDAKTGKPIKVTKYLPTDIVTYDEATKEYVVTVAEEEQTVDTPAEDVAGSDFDKDAETFQEEAAAESTETEEAEPVMAEATVEEHNEMPWE